MTECSHDRYRASNYMCHPKALKDSNIAWIGMIIKECQDCGQDIEFAKRAPVLTADEYLKNMRIDYSQKKKRRTKHG